ncbi:hypothetical protein V7S43_001587 [Phytophthora oleae]|uniref:EXS domain-containing protein n=1 Tax=Phytophthora oleae TaxID=2107226 RepID=A0ABD3G7D1_9STRA
MSAFVKRKLASVWKAAQVELQGEYSTKRVQDLFTFVNEASSFRVLLAQLLTPLPCLGITAIVDLLPLRPVEDDVNSNHLFFIRAFIAFWLANTTTYNQFKHIVPQLPLSNTRIASFGAIVAAITVVVMYGLTLVVGFPLPFSIITMSPLWLSLFMMPMVPWMIKSRMDPTTWPLVTTSLKVMICQEIMVVVYPTYFYAFTTIPDSGKTYFALLLPLLKLIFRNAMAKTVGYLSDEVPEGVILNVEVVSALFVAYCMQNTPSLTTMAALMAIDALQISASLYDIGVITGRMEALRKRTKQNKSTDIRTGRCNSELKIAHEIFSRCTSSQKASGEMKPSPCHSSIRKLSSAVHPFEREGQTTSIVPVQADPVRKSRSGPQDSDVSSARDTRLELQYVQELKRVLYITEFVVLLNYVEVIIPLIFSAYLLMMYHLPNRAYYKQIDGMDKAQLWYTLSNVLLYAGLQLVSLLVLNLVLWYKMRLSGFRQLSFVLERQCSPVQNKLILWVFYNVQTALQHFGFDFAFTFAWLRSHTS